MSAGHEGAGQWRCATKDVHDRGGEPTDDEGLLDALAARFGELGGVDLDLPARSTAPRAVDFSR